jgi:hypothetical protein
VRRRKLGTSMESSGVWVFEIEVVVDGSVEERREGISDWATEEIADSVY